MLEGGANARSLVESQRTYQEVGASEYRFVGDVRMATAGEPVEEGFRTIDLAIDRFEEPYVQEAAWPEDRIVLYWWRPTFWRHPRGNSSK